MQVIVMFVTGNTMNIPTSLDSISIEWEVIYGHHWKFFFDSSFLTTFGYILESIGIQLHEKKEGPRCWLHDLNLQDILGANSLAYPETFSILDDDLKKIPRWFDSQVIQH